MISWLIFWTMKIEVNVADFFSTFLLVHPSLLGQFFDQQIGHKTTNFLLSEQRANGMITTSLRFPCFSR